MKAAAEQGDARAELAYGKALEYERMHGNKQVTEATVRAWFQKAADQGSGEAWFWIGYTTTDQKLLRTSYVRAAELGFAPAFDDVFELLLFRAGESADVDKAKYFADLVREKNIEIYDKAEILATVDTCYAAGKPWIADSERAAILGDGRTDQSYTPNDSIKFAEAFANGWGVSRDINRAIAFDCHGNTVPAELIFQVKHLQERATAKSPEQPFIFCHELTSGMNGGQCAAFSENGEQRQRDTRLANLSAGFTLQQKAAFNALQQAANAYFDAHSGDEQDMSGTLRGAFYEEEIGRLRTSFLNALRRFEHGQLPPKGNFIQADRSLNSLYRDIRSTTDWTSTGTVRFADVRKTEQLWLKYRDAWANFGPLRYPNRSANDFRCWVTRERIVQLKGSFDLTGR